MVNLQKVLIVMVLLSVTMSAGAATVSLGVFDASIGDTRSFDFLPADLPVGPVNADVTFSISNAGTGANSSLTGTALKLPSFGLDILNPTAALSGGTLGGVLNLTPNTTGLGVGFIFNGLLGNGAYTLLLGGSVPSGTNGAITGQVTVSPVSAVPVPAAVWLFGSALVGLFGAKRRTAA